MTAVNFVVSAAGLFALTTKRTGKLAGTLGALVTVISAIILVGYWYGTPLLYGGTIIPVALSTACAFFLCGVGMMTAGPAGWPLRAFRGDSTRAFLLRAFVPVVIAAALLNGWVNATLWERIRANPAVSSAIGTIVFVIVITWIISQVSRVVGGRIDRAEEARNLAQAELVALNAELEARVEKRTRQLHEKNQQMEEELQMARELQMALLPQRFPSIPADVTTQESAFRFLSLYFPTGDVSGDFFQCFSSGRECRRRSHLRRHGARGAVRLDHEHDPRTGGRTRAGSSGPGQTSHTREPCSRGHPEAGRDDDVCDLFLCGGRRATC